MARLSLRSGPFAEEQNCPVPEHVLGIVYAAQHRDPTAALSTLPALQRARLAVFCYGRAHLRELARVIAATCEEADLVEVAGKLGATLFRQSREQEEVPQPRLHKRPVTLAKFVPSRFPAELYDNDDEAEPSHLQQ
jgi:hypothetical protein